MRCSELNRDLGFLCRSVFGFIDRSFSAAMGCFIGCFRVRDDRSHRRSSRPHLVVSDTSRPKLTEVVASQNRLSALFLSEEDPGDSPCKGKISGQVRTPSTDKQLKNEAKFLKACGTLSETPIEIRKASAKLNGSPLHGDCESSKFHSWLPSTSVKKLQLDKPFDQPSTPSKSHEPRAVVDDVSSDQTPSGCVSNLQNDGSVSICSGEGSGTSNRYTPQVLNASVGYKSKSVRFECDLDTSSSQGSSSEDYNNSLKKVDSSLGNRSISSFSPYPTPLKLSVEMQTPGTVFPSNLDNIPNGKSRIRSQYVFSVLNPIESDSRWSVLKEEDSFASQLSSEVVNEPLGKHENETPVSKETTKDEMNVEASLSAWLKPVEASTRDCNFVGLSKHPKVAYTPSERPIIGTVAAHWNNDEPSQISPKWWDGNGIPNSTNKYKEDQKVSWHATPFEERLEKALSEESVISQQRKPICGTPIAFEETEESDSALSTLQTSSHPKSVVSF